MRAFLILLLFGPGLPEMMHAQTVVAYTTHADLLARQGDTLGVYLGISGRTGAYVLRLARDGRKQKIPCAGSWGFTVNDALFRVHPETGAPVRLMAQGVVCYYENGFAHLRMQQKGTEMEPIGPGHRSYLGRHPEGDIVPALFGDGKGPETSQRFRSAHPELAPLFQCIGMENDLDRTRQCVVDLEVLVEELGAGQWPTHILPGMDRP